MLKSICSAFLLAIPTMAQAAGENVAEVGFFTLPHIALMFLAVMSVTGVIRKTAYES